MHIAHIGRPLAIAGCMLGFCAWAFVLSGPIDDADGPFTHVQSQIQSAIAYNSAFNAANLIPGDFAIPRNAVSVRLTINPSVNEWFSAAVDGALKQVKFSRATRAATGDAPLRVNAVLADRKGRIRTMYSNQVATYLGPEPVPLASTGKVFVALALGKHDEPGTRYCIPRVETSWPAIDALGPAACPAGARTVSARIAFAQSMPKPLLWRSHQVLTEPEFRTIFWRLGLPVSVYPSLRAASILGAVKARPLLMHRAIHAMTLGLAGFDEPAEMPTLIDAVEVRSPDGHTEEQSIGSAAISAQTYRSVITPEVARYVREVLFATIRTGTLQDLSTVRFRKKGISLIWGKTGTFAQKSDTLHAWIVGGLVVDGEPYSWLLLVSTANREHALGNTNAAAFAPIAKLLIEAAVRDRASQQTNSIRLPIDPTSGQLQSQASNKRP